VSLSGKDISLPRKEFELLFLLCSKPGKVFKREFILESVWGKDVWLETEPLMFILEN